MRYYDEEERELIESIEDALERGEVAQNTPEELARLNAEWKKIAEASLNREAVSLRLDARDLERLKDIARDRGVPFEVLIHSVLHKFATGALRETS